MRYLYSRLHGFVEIIDHGMMYDRYGAVEGIYGMCVQHGTSVVAQLSFRYATPLEATSSYNLAHWSSYQWFNKVE